MCKLETKNRDVVALYAFLDRINESSVRANEVIHVLGDVRRHVDHIERTWPAHHLEAPAVSEAVALDTTLALRRNAFGTEAYESRLLHLAALATHLVAISRRQRLGRPDTREPRSVEDFDR